MLFTILCIIYIYIVPQGYVLSWPMFTKLCFCLLLSGKLTRLFENT